MGIGGVFSTCLQIERFFRFFLKFMTNYEIRRFSTDIEFSSENRKK